MRPHKIVIYAVGVILILNSFSVKTAFSQEKYYTYVVIGAFAVLKNAENHTRWANNRDLNAAFAMRPGRGLYYVYSFQTMNHGTAIEEVYKVRTLIPDAWVYTGPLEGIEVDLSAISSNDMENPGDRDGLPTRGAVMFGKAGPGTEVSAVIEGATYKTTTNPDGTWMIDLVNDQPVIPADGNKRTGTQLRGKAAPGEKISMNLMGKTFVKYADADGNWTLNSTGSPDEIGSGSILTGKAERGSTVTAMIGGVKYIAGADENGNWRIDPVQDEAISIESDASSQIVYGGKADAGSKVSTTLGGTRYSTQVDSNGNWEIDAGEKKMTGTSKAGSTITAIVGGATYEVIADENGKWTVDASVDQPTGDEMEGIHTVLMGTDTPGKVIEMMIDGEKYLAVTNSDGNWKINTAAKPLSGDAAPGSIIRTLHNGAMYETRADEDGVWSIDPQKEQPISLGHNTGSSTLLSGKSQPGFKVEMTIDGHTYNAMPDADGNWSLNTDAQIMTGMAEPGSMVRVEVAGATYEATADEYGIWKVDPKSTSPVSAGGPMESMSTVVTGKGTPGSIMSTKVGGKTYSVMVEEDGEWSLDTSSEAVTGKAKSGTTVTAVVNGKTYSTIAAANGIWTIDPKKDQPISMGDGVKTTNKMVSGTAAPGEVVETIIDGEVYSAIADEEGKWEIDTGNAVLSGIVGGESTITATINGKSVSVNANADGSWDMDPVEKNIDFRPDDDVKLTGVGEPGETIKAKVGDKMYEAVADESGNWTIDTAEGQNATFLKYQAGNLDKVQRVEIELEELRPPEVIAPEGVPEPELDGDYKVFINSYDHQYQRVKGPVEILDVVRLRKLRDAESQTLIGVKDPKNGTTSVEIVSRIFGYRPFSANFNLNDPIATDTTGNVTTNGDSIIVAMPLHRLEKGDIAVMWNVLFFKDAAIMRPESRPELNSLLIMLQEVPDMEVILHGHTNSNRSGKIIHLNERDAEYFSMNAEHRESKGSAKKLSEERAYTIQQWLISQGIDESRTEVKGWGGKKMLFDSDDPNAFKNVRVEVEIK